MNGGLLYTDDDGRDWTVTLEAPGKVMSVPRDVEKAGGLLPEHELRIVFRSGDACVSQEYTAFTPLEDLSDDDLKEWLDAANRRSGV